MKKIILILIVLLSISTKAQDTIVFKNGGIYELKQTYPKEIPDTLAKKLYTGEVDSIAFGTESTIIKISLYAQIIEREILYQKYSSKNFKDDGTEKRIGQTSEPEVTYIFLAIILIILGVKISIIPREIRGSVCIRKKVFIQNLITYSLFVLSWVVIILFVHLPMLYLICFAICSIISLAVNELTSFQKKALIKVEEMRWFYEMRQTIFPWITLLPVILLVIYMLLGLDWNHLKLDMPSSIFIAITAIIPTGLKLLLIWKKNKKKQIILNEHYK